jgi:eukaryotic-like serine/threonine-protein kinase
VPSYQLEKGRDVPARLGRYELLGHLATGGMAEIHLARLAGEGGFEKVVVVKRLLPELVASPAYVAMFLDEGKLVARLDHPNICEVYELGRDGAEYYLAMPYLEGVPVHELIARPRDPDRASQLRVAAAVIVQACEGLHHAHELRDADGAPAGLVHRDVSPSNLFVTASGIVKVLDFGIAKVRGAAETEVGTVKGKSQYMAPEQLLGDPVDRRCDVFALGIVLFELATHQRLFKRASEYLAARAILEEPIPRADAVDPAVPAALADVIAKALSRERGERHADARALADAVRAAITPAAVGEVAATVTSSEELSAQRTRQTRVLDDAKSRQAVPVATAAVTRPLRRPVDADKTDITAPPTFTQRTQPARRRHAAVVAGAGLAAGVLALVAVFLIDREPDPVVYVALPEIKPPPPPPAPPPVEPAPITEPEPEIEMAPTSARAPKKAPGQLSIDSTPYATIYVDGVKLGVTPIVKRSLPAGRHKLRAVLEDGRAKDLAIDVPANKLARPIQLTW